MQRYIVEVTQTDTLKFPIDVEDGVTPEQVAAYVSGLGQGIPEELLAQVEADGAIWENGPPVVSVTLPMIEHKPEPPHPDKAEAEDEPEAEEPAE